MNTGKDGYDNTDQKKGSYHNMITIHLQHTIEDQKQLTVYSAAAQFNSNDQDSFRSVHFHQITEPYGQISNTK